MKIKLKTDRVGNGLYQPKGTIIEVSATLGARMIESGQADPLTDRVETAAMKRGAREVRKPRKRKQAKRAD